MSDDVRGTLNPEQQAAVVHGDGPLLVLAGAGTGKTRVLVHRIAHLVESGVAPWQVLAVTFTNKAAGEMRERLTGLLGDGAERMWIGTFHATCARILRRWGERVGLRKGFLIYDDDDQLKLVNRLLKESGTEEQVTPRTMLVRFDRAKNQGVDPTSVKRGDFVDDLVATIYPKYRDQLLRENAVDFNDLILHVLTLCKDAEAGPRLATQFRHVLVDEFQDTNRVQYELVRHLSSGTRNLTVVGDDDQSIYRWRGAEPRNILDFDRDHPDAAVVKLEQNYRSTSTILDAANAVISKNADRHGKSLWTDRGGGDSIEYKQAGDDRGEAWDVARAIQQMIDDGGVSPRDVAILYRTNAQSRPLEEQLRRYGVPYQVVGAVSFFERKEIKDAVAYLRLVVNPATDSAFDRVVNEPPRGIGQATIDRLRAHVGATGASLLDAARLAARGDVAGLGPGPRKKLQTFVELVGGLADVIAAGASVAETLIQVVERSGIRQRYEAMDSEEGRDRLGNLSQLVNLAADYDDEAGEEGSLEGFLEQTSLTAPADDKEQGDAVRMMTIHMAKGLEFPIVFLCGMEDGLFPSMREREGTSEAESLEEERRLAYVAITRARDRLFLSSARVRRVWGKDSMQAPSRFLDDIPAGCLSQPIRPPTPVRPVLTQAPPMAVRKPKREWDEFDQRTPQADDEPVYRLDADVRDDARAAADPNDPYRPGRSVSHAAFGAGKVVEARGSGALRAVVVDFASVGRKTVLVRFLAPA
jgi:DNA helicase-2/ATP-dependent DNA helicase PcrA